MRYVPERGDIIWTNFDPQAGHEQAGRRPGLVLSPKQYNQRGLMLVCPLTSRRKNYAFEVPVAVGKIKGCVLADHVKSQDWHSRGAAFAGKAPDTTLQQVLRIIALLLTDG